MFCFEIASGITVWSFKYRTNILLIVHGENSTQWIDAKYESFNWNVNYSFHEGLLNDESWTFLIPYVGVGEQGFSSILWWQFGSKAGSSNIELRVCVLCWLEKSCS